MKTKPTVPVIATNPETGEEKYYPSVKSAAEAVGATKGAITQACVCGWKCRGFYWRREGE